MRRGLLVLLLVGLGLPSTHAQDVAPTSALTLERALALAAANNEIPGIAAARLERAAALRRQARATLLPRFTLSGTYTRRAREVTRVVNGEELVIQTRDALLGQTILDGTLLDARVLPVAKSAALGLAAQELESAELRRALAFEVGEAFFAVLSSERLREAAARRLEVAEATVSDSRLRLEAGLAARNDLTRSDLELASARLALIQIQNAASAARRSLGFLIAQEVTGTLAEPGIAAHRAVGATLVVAPARDSAKLQAIAAGQRADLKALSTRAEAARHLAREPLLRFVPSLNLRGNYRVTNEEGLSGRPNDYSVATTLNWELFDGGVRNAEAAARRATYREILLQAEALRRRIGLEIESALADLSTAEAAFDQAAVFLEVARQNATEVRERFGSGLATALERADAAVAQFEAEAELARQRFALAVTGLALQYAIGGWPAAGVPGRGDAGAALAVVGAGLVPAHGDADTTPAAEGDHKGRPYNSDRGGAR